MRKLRFQTKLFIYYSIVIAAIIGLSFASFYLYISNDLKDREKETLTQIVSKTMDQLDSMFIEMDKISISVLSNPIVITNLSQARENQNTGNYFETALRETRELSYTLLSIQGASLPVSRISIYNDKNDYMEYGIYIKQPSAVKRFVQTESFEKKYKTVIEQSGNRLLLGPHDDYWSDNNRTSLISLFREIKDLDTYKSFGIVEIQQPYDKLEKICNIGRRDSLKVYLITDTNSLAYPIEKLNQPETNEILAYYSKQLSSNSEGVLRVANPVTLKNEILAFKTSSFSKWTMITVETEENILKPIYVFGKIMLITGTALVMITLLVMFFITKRITKPLKDLQKSLDTVNLSNLSLKIGNDYNNDELVNLNTAFKSMFKRVKDSMNQVMQYRSQEAKAHVLVLQSQMNPHFLYNMLSVISCISYESGVPQIADISHKLSNMLRYTTSFDDNGTTIESEVNNAINYSDLMKQRYEEKLIISFDIDEKALRINVPKLILQPLIENCFQHAFNNIDYPWIIAVKVACTDDTWKMEVYDNGSGCDKQIIDNIKIKSEEFLNDPSTNFKDMRVGGLALLNTYIRLKLLYKESFIFKIESNSGIGTKITIGGSIL